MRQVKKILLTGATGFIGQHLIKELNDDSYSLYVLSRQKRLSTQFNVTYLKGDLFKLETIKDYLSQIDYVVHIAGEKKIENKMHLVNVEGTSSLLKEIQHFPNIKLLHISSAGVYGIERYPKNIITEKDECFPLNTYEKTKLEADKLIIENKLNRYCILRPSNVFGENDKENKLLFLFKSLIRKQFFYINKSAVTNYVYVGQLTLIIKKIIDKGLFNNKIYNVNTPITISDFIEKTKENLNLNYKTFKANGILKYGLKLIAFVLSLIPVRYQFFNNGKYRELTSFKYYSTKSINQDLNLNENELFFLGVRNLITYYKSKKML